MNMKTPAANTSARMLLSTFILCFLASSPLLQVQQSITDCLVNFELECWERGRFLNVSVTLEMTYKASPSSTINDFKTSEYHKMSQISVKDGDDKFLTAKVILSEPRKTEYEENKISWKGAADENGELIFVRG